MRTRYSMRRREGLREEHYMGQAINPTADEAIARADGYIPPSATSLPPPDREWIPQLYAEFGNVAAVMRESGLPRARVKAILIAAGIEIRTRSQKSA